MCLSGVLCMPRSHEAKMVQEIVQTDVSLALVAVILGEHVELHEHFFATMYIFYYKGEIKT